MRILDHMYVIVNVSVFEGIITTTAICIIMEGRFQAFQVFSSSKLVLKTVENCFAALTYSENTTVLKLGEVFV
jgi:hypothetical protein